MDSSSLRATSSSCRRPDAAASPHGVRLWACGVGRPRSHRVRRSSEISRSAFCVSGRAAQLGLARCFAQADMLEDRGEDMRSAAGGSFSESYKLGELLGLGSFGKVYRAASRAPSGQDFAVKIVSKHREGVLDERIARRIHEEIAILERLQSRPEALRLVEVFEDEDRVWIVTEICLGGDLELFLKDYGFMTEAEAAHAAHDVLQVLAECHRQGICYADVKPANFLLKRPYSRHGSSDSDSQTSRLLELRVADFGCSQHLQKSEKLNKRTGTPLYMAPELFMRYYGIESDQWALGIMMYQLLSGHLPFWDAQSDRSPLAVMSAILHNEVHFEGDRWEGISEAAKDFVSRLLDKDYNTRMTATEALQHPWIAEHCNDDGCSVANNVVQLKGRNLHLSKKQSTTESCP